MSEHLTPLPSSDAERAALMAFCPTCFAHEGEWCATTAARNDYTSKLHPARFLLPVGDVPPAPNDEREQ